MVQPEKDHGHATIAATQIRPGKARFHHLQPSMSMPDLISIPGYTVHQLLGKGGMAAVYLATQESLHRKVAVKVLLHSDDAAFNERFVSEARIIATLNHPRVITVHDVAQLPDGRHYIAMEYLGGGDLTRFKGQALPVELALDLTRQIAEGLSVVHRNGIIHRDIKPGNILFREDGSLVLTDFGIAKDMTSDTDLTQTGMTLGSPSYCSPEQTHCEPLDARTDIYSLGVILLEMLLGYNPYRGNNYTQTVLNHTQMPVPVLPADLADYQSLLEKMLAKSPQDRFGSVDELLIALRGVPLTSSLDPTITFQSAAPVRAKRKQNVWAMVAIIVSCFFLGLTGSGFYWWKQKYDRDIKIANLLGEARIRLAAGKLTLPDQDNAEYFYHAVLALDPQNADAQRGLQDVETRYITEMLRRAEDRLNDQKLTTPPRDNAAHFFQQVLIIDPDNATAKEGLARVVAIYAGMAQKSWARGDYLEAQQYADKGLSLDPDNASLIELKNRKPPANAPASTPRRGGRSNPLERLINRIFH